jgi:hypothetical protein
VFQLENAKGKILLERTTKGEKTMAIRRYETIKVFDFSFKNKREAMLAQQSLRNKLFHSLTIYSFASYVYSRGNDKKAFHWATKIMSNNGLRLTITMVRVKTV